MSQSEPRNSDRLWMVFVLLAILLLVVTTYWPVIHGEFVWDDLIDFRDNAWLTAGDAWKHYIFRDFHHWTNYFRPLVVASFTAQLRLFDIESGPMHAVSLGIHLANTLLVGLIARRCCDAAGISSLGRVVRVGVSALLFGLHPALIETVAWIGCQFDLAVTFFTLLGLLGSISIDGRLARPIMVALCFFLAACAKESAVAFPLQLLIVDWIVQSRRDGDLLLSSRLRTFTSRNAATYVGVLVAGFAYLAFRYWALGTDVVTASDGSISAFGRFQLGCHTYLRYWLAILAPTVGMSPLHPFDPAGFESLTWVSLMTNIGAMLTVVSAAYFTLLRRSAAAGIVLLVTVSLLPVLRIFPVAFDQNLFHYRYLTTALAAGSALLPLLSFGWLRRLDSLSIRRLSAAFGVVGVIWMCASIVTIRTTLPLWANSVNLWRWALNANPDSIYAKDWLLVSYLESGHDAQAQVLISQLLSERTSCGTCLVNIAIHAMNHDDLETAETALDRARNTRDITAHRLKYGLYLNTLAKLLILRREWRDAELVLDQAIELLPTDVRPRMQLAVVMEATGRNSAANDILTAVLAMTPPDRHEAVRATMAQHLSRATRSTPPPERRPSFKPMAP